MNWRRSIAAVAVAAIILALSASNALALRNSVAPKAPKPTSATEQTPVPEEEEISVGYIAVSGRIKEVTKVVDADGLAVEGSFFVLVEDENGGEAVFTVTEDTYLFNGRELTVGELFTGYVDGSRPMILIYPPRYQVDVAVVGQLSEGHSLLVDTFDHNLVNSAGTVKLDIDDSTQVLSPNGTPYKGALENRTLAALYGAMTRSMPGQTTPMQVIVLPQADALYAMPAIERIVVQDILLENVALPYYVGTTAMAPLRPIAEALGYQVGYEDATGIMTLGHTVSVTVGEDRYVFARMAPISLGIAPELVDDEVYVPLHFFAEVLGMNNAYVLEGQLVVDDGEKMR